MDANCSMVDCEAVDENEDGARRRLTATAPGLVAWPSVCMLSKGIGGLKGSELAWLSVSDVTSMLCSSSSVQEGVSSFFSLFDFSLETLLLAVLFFAKISTASSVKDAGDINLLTGLIISLMFGSFTIAPFRFSFMLSSDNDFALSLSFPSRLPREALMSLKTFACDVLASQSERASPSPSLLLTAVAPSPPP